MILTYQRLPILFKVIQNVAKAPSCVRVRSHYTAFASPSPSPPSFLTPPLRSPHLLSLLPHCAPPLHSPTSFPYSSPPFRTPSLCSPTSFPYSPLQLLLPLFHPPSCPSPILNIPATECLFPSLLPPLSFLPLPSSSAPPPLLPAPPYLPLLSLFPIDHCSVE